MAIDNQQIILTDLIDVPTLQKIQDAFANATGMAALTVDLNGPVTHLSNPTEFCMKLTRGCSIGAERCNQCDLQGGETAGRTKRPSVYYCHGGLMDFAAPILLGNRQIGSMIGGQVLPSPPDEKKFRAIAKEIGVDENTYIKALSKIKVLPKKSIEASADLLYIMANSLSEMGYQKFITQGVTEQLIQLSSQINKTVEKAVSSIAAIESQNIDLTNSMQRLSDSTRNSKEEVEKTNQIVKYISDVSMQTKLLGFNASVEAARAGANGAGFGIIAQEIRRLADDSQSYFNKIEGIIGAVRSMTLDIDKKILDTNEMVSNNADQLDSISDLMEQIESYTKDLEKIGKQL